MLKMSYLRNDRRLESGDVFSGKTFFVVVLERDAERTQFHKSNNSKSILTRSFYNKINFVFSRRDGLDNPFLVPTNTVDKIIDVIMRL